MPTETFTDDVIIDGSQDEVQLQVQGNNPQNEALQEWQDYNGNPLARITADGRFQSGDMPLSTADALIEAHRDDPSSLPQRGIHSLGKIAGVITTAIAWMVGELELVGTAAISSIHTAIRGRLTHSSTGDSSNAELRAGDFETINQSGTSGTPVGTAIGVQATVDNQSNAYLSKASGVVAQLQNATGADIETAVALEVAPPVNAGTIDTLIGLEIADINEGTDNYALRTGDGVVHVGDVLDLVQQVADPANKADVVQFYAKGDKLFAKAADPDNTVYDLTASGGSSASVMSGATSSVDGAEGLVPQPLAGDEAKLLQGDGTWVSPTDEMQGATSSVNGVEGLVPQPLAGDEGKYLKGDGSWDAPNLVAALDDLSDVDTTGASSGDVLGFDGTDWSAVTPSGGGGSHTHTLSEITDAGDVASQNKNNVYFSGGDLDGVDINNASFIGGTNVDVDYIKTGGFESENDGYSTDNHTVASSYGNHNLHLQRARGTIASPTAIQSGDILGRFSTKGYDGSGYQDGPHLLSVAEANWSSSSRKAKLELHVADTGYTRLAARLESSRALALKNKDSGVSVSSNWGWVKLWSDSGEMKVMDESGNVTTLSSHNPQLVDASERPTSYIHAERNPFTGKYIEMDIFRALQLLEQLTGEDLIHVTDLPTEQRLDWAENEARQAAERALEIERWNTTPAEERRSEQPTVYTERPEPQFLQDARAWRKPDRLV